MYNTLTEKLINNIIDSEYYSSKQVRQQETPKSFLLIGKSENDVKSKESSKVNITNSFDTKITKTPNKDTPTQDNN